MKTYLLTTLFFLLCLISFGQFVDRYGVYIQRNAATQSVRNPQNPRDGNFTWDPVFTWGAGLYGSWFLGRGESLKMRIAYIPKGFRDDFTLNGVRQRNNRNLLHYLSIDALIQKTWGGGFMRPFVGTGLSWNVLVHREIDDVFNTINSIAHISPDNYRILAVSGDLNAGTHLGRFMMIETNLSLDIIPALSQVDAIVRNWVASLAVGIHLSEIIIN